MSSYYSLYCIDCDKELMLFHKANHEYDYVAETGPRHVREFFDVHGGHYVTLKRDHCSGGGILLLSRWWKGID